MCYPAPAFSTAGNYRAVYFDGPQSDCDAEGEEIPAWVVYVGDADAEPVAQVYTCHDFNSAEQLAKRMATDRRLDLIHEASPA
jgi:hypothetical protein